jgi:malonyl-CoA O-methyltransferase
VTQTRARRIREAFGKARNYDSHAQVQAATARQLAWLALESGLPDKARVLDMGCGTGGLAGHLYASGKLESYLGADISPAMLDRAKGKLSKASPTPLFAAMDASAPALKKAASPGSGFHLAVSNMALHWTPDLGWTLAALWELVLPGGLLAVAVPGENTFRAWRDAHERLDLPCGLQDFPSATDFAGMFPTGHTAQAGSPMLKVTQETRALKLRDALDLPRHLKAVGGCVARPGHTPLTPDQFRAVLAELDRSGPGLPSIGYHVLYGLARKPSPDQPLHKD